MKNSTVSKSESPIPYLICYIGCAFLTLGFLLGGCWPILGLGYIFVLHPFLDVFFGESVIDEHLNKPPHQRYFYRGVLWGYVGIQFALLVWGLRIGAKIPVFSLRFLATAVGIGAMTGALGITGAHELIHRKGRFERGLGVTLLLMVNYSHFRIEHVYGHHKSIATPEDPASADLGDVVYAFWGRSLIGGYLNAWRLEKARLRRLKISSGQRFLRNRMVHYSVAEAVILAVIATTLGASAVAMFMVQGLVAVLLLETINYVEHYGLRRKQIAPGVYEAISARHSWDSRFRMTNWSLFNLGRHSEHHHRAGLEYWVLTNPEESRALPYGYSVMIIMAFVPPLWRKVMDPLALQYRAQDLGQIQ